MLAAAQVAACAGDGTAATARPAGTLAATLEGEDRAMPGPTASDLDWLDRLVALLRTPATTKASVADFIGVGLADTSAGGWSAAGRYGLARVRIHDLLHVDIDVAVDVVFDAGARPRLADLTARLGAPRTLPHMPDAIARGSRVAFYPQSGDDPAIVRVFATLEPDGSTATEMRIDRSIPERRPE